MFKLHMKKQLAIFGLGLFFYANTSFATVPLGATSLAPMLQKVLPAIVNIRAQVNTLMKPDDEQQIDKNKGNGNNNQDNGSKPPMPDKALSVASGVIVDANKGYILTNSHAIEDAQAINITLSDGRHYTAKVLGMDKPSDIALLQIQAKNLTAITISDSNQLKVGDIVAAIGNPYGLNQSVTAGIVSALGRTTLGIESYENFIQTDAPINPGNSGGALVNTQGELVGINTAIFGPNRGSVGIGFAIPSNMAKSVMQQLIEYGNVQRGALGIAAQDVTPELASAFGINIEKGAAVTQVLANSPAEQAGLQVGDIITAINGAEVKSANDVVNGIGFLRVNSRANIQFLRSNRSHSVNVVISDPKKRMEISQSADPFLYGIGLKDFTLLSPVHGNVKGILVVSVEEDSNAWQSDLLPGDVITYANQQKVTNIAELRKIASDTKQTLLLNVLRGPGAVFLVINKEQ